MDSYHFSHALESWMTAVFACNQFVDTRRPWALRKTDPDRMAAVLGTLFARSAIWPHGSRPSCPAPPIRY
jgi:methionyl-tRNA synthetase